MITTPQPALFLTIGVMFACLIAGSLVRFFALRNAEPELRSKRFASLRTWWMLAIAVSAGLLAGRLGICLLLAAASCIAWHEVTRMHGLRPQDGPAVRAGYVLIILNYLVIAAGSTTFFPVFLPLSAMVVFAVLVLWQDEPKGYIRSTGALLWGILFLGYGVSHAAFLMIMPATAGGPLDAAGWFLFVVILTETDDIFQAVVGRALGAHKRHCIAPVISPNKTWEGFVGGLLVIAVLAPLIAPWLTTLGQQPGPLGLPDFLQPFFAPVTIAVLISFAGFFGDINMSAIKRDAGVKDSSKLLPGMGGVIDRIDSLTMTAPVYVYFLTWWYA